MKPLIAIFVALFLVVSTAIVFYNLREPEDLLPSKIELIVIGPLDNHRVLAAVKDGNLHVILEVENPYSQAYEHGQLITIQFIP